MPRKKDSVTKTFTLNGQRHYATGATLKEAEDNADRMKHDLKSGILVVSETTVNDWIQNWIATYKEGRVGDHWLTAIKGMCKNYIAPAIGLVKINDVRPVQLEQILNNNKKSYSFNNQLYGVIREMFRDAYLNDLTTADVSDKLRKPKGAAYQHRRSITDQEREVLLRVLEDHPGKRFCYLMLYAGLRPGEVCALKWSDVDLNERVITISRALKADGMIVAEPKTSAGRREVPIPDKLLEELQKGSHEANLPVCHTSAGTAYSRQSFKRMWNSVKRDINIDMGCELYRNQLVPPLPLADDFYLYCLRHTYCTDLQSAGVPINVARELMGHSSIAITSRIYTHHSNDSLLSALDSINSYQK